MRDYGKVHTTFWTSSTTRSMSEDARILALYLITSPHSTIAGVFRLPDGYVCEDLQWSAERVSKGFAELFRKGFGNRCETTKWVWVCKHLEWNPPENPNQRKSAAKIAQAIPDECSWKPAFMRVCGPLLDLKWEPSDNPSGTVPEPFLNQEQEQEQEQEKNTPPPPKGGRFEEFWTSWPKSERKQDKAKCEDKWRRGRLDAVADAILADLALKKLTEKWRGGYVEAPLVYLNGKRWEDGVTPDGRGEAQADWTGAAL